MTSFLWRLLAALFLLLHASLAFAADEAPILLVVRGDPLPTEELRTAVARELARPVVLSGAAAGGVVTVTYRASARELAVTWDGPRQGTVSRVVSAPSASSAVARTAAMLAGNLARDEADDLVRPAAADAMPATPPETSAPAPAPAPGKTVRVPVTVGLFYPLASNLGQPHVRTHADLNLLHGRMGALQGIGLGGVNVVNGGDEASGDVEGIQLAWLGNVVTGRVEGWQTGMLFNQVRGSTAGLQLGAVNLTGDLEGMQLGVINVAHKARGVMLGLVNVADDVDGLPLGLVSVTKTGGVHPRAWASNETYANIGIKLATRYTYTMPTGHYHRAYGVDFYGAGFALGAHVPLGRTRAYAEIELAAAWLHASTRTLGRGALYHQQLVQPRARVLFGYRFADHFGLFAGAGVVTQVRLLEGGDDVAVKVSPDFVLGIEL